MWFDPIRFSRFFAELELFDTPAARKEAWDRAIRVSVKTWQCLCFLVGNVVVMLVALWILGRFLVQSHVGLAGILCGFAVTYAWLWLGAKFIRRSLRAQLNEQGISVCMKCGYQLRGHVEARCPECGRTFNASRLRRNAD